MCLLETTFFFSLKSRIFLLTRHAFDCSPYNILVHSIGTFCALIRTFCARIRTFRAHIRTFRAHIRTFRAYYGRPRAHYGALFVHFVFVSALVGADIVLRNVLVMLYNVLYIVIFQSS